MVKLATGSDEARARAAAAALEEVKPGMKLGIGTGRTAEQFIRLLGERVRAGLDVVGVPTSQHVATLAAAEGIKLTTLDDQPSLDLDIDGADEIDPSLRLIKGGGGALLREKIVATASARMIVVAEASKLVAGLGAFALPVEVVPFGLGATRAAIQNAAGKLGLSGSTDLRSTNGRPYVTDGGHHILDISFGAIPDPEKLARALDAIPGVVEHGLFIGLASIAIVARGNTIERLTI
jgi:ribose 5-phosphate isomerase A